MGLSLSNRFFSGIRSAVNTVAVAEAHMAKTKKAEAPKNFPELGVLQFGSRFRGMEGAINPFNSGVRPATGPTIGRPGLEQFKGTGGAFAPEQSLGMTSGFRGLNAPMMGLEQLQALGASNPQLQAVAGQMAGMGMGPDLGFGPLGQIGGSQLPGQLQSMPMEMMRQYQTQQQMEQISRLFQTISSILKAQHEIAMNSIRNLKG